MCSALRQKPNIKTTKKINNIIIKIAYPHGLRLKTMKSNQSKAKKIYNAVSTVIVALIFVFMIVVVAVMLVQKNNGGETELFGYRMYDVLTDSMSGTIEPGDVIMCKSVEDVNALQVGDIITFKAPNGNYNETHRIIEIVKNDDGTVKYFKTKGDNAKEADKWELAPENVKAKYVKKSVFIGGLRRFMSHWYGYVAVVVIPLCIVFALIIASFVRDKVAIETEKKKENKKLTLDDISDEEKLKLLDSLKDENNCENGMTIQDDIAEKTGENLLEEAPESTSCDDKKEQ